MTKLLEPLLTRNSASKLSLPAPSDAQLRLLLQAALRAPDHANLRPWRFIIIKDERRDALGDLLVAAKQAELSRQSKPLLDETAQKKLKAKPLRAPLIIVPIMRYQEHASVPEVEQVLSLGCACQNILLAAEALSYAAIWRTGSLAFSDEVAQGFDLAKNEKALGFIYVGTRDSKYPVKSIPQHNVDDFISHF
ncbi:MAG: nitroreductase [Sinobacterium sp.]|nr:nitroreductase [Sinobacterium sp.]